MSFQDLFFKYYSGIFAQKLNGRTSHASCLENANEIQMYNL